MRRRRFIVGTIVLSGVLAGCLSSDSSADSDDQSTTQTPDSSQPTQLNILPVEQSTPGSDGKFTETDRSSPLEAEAFIGVYEEILQSKDLQIAWTSNVRGETVEVLYPADDTNHEQRMSVFVDAFIELTRQTGGAGRDMRFVVKTSGSAWYEWELPDDLAHEYLHGEISYGELFESINETIETIEEPRGPPSGTEPESDADLTPEGDDDADRSGDADRDGDGDGDEDGDEEGDERDNNDDDERDDDDDERDRESDTGTASGFAVRIRYDDEWSGVVGSDEQTRSIDGSGTETIAIEDDHPVMITVNAQKLDDGDETLTVQILEGNEVRKEASTDAEYGVASVSHSP